MPRPAANTAAHTAAAFRSALLVIIALPLLAACGATATPENYFARNDIPQPSLDKFPHCRGYGCQWITPVGLDKKEWKRIQKGFPAKTAKAERDAIARAIGTFETIVGNITDTHGDVAGTYARPGPYQLDCIDESTNTTVYLTLLSQKNWLKFHDVMAPDTRVPFGVGVFVAHRTAVIRDRQTGERYAVDSWFHDNGHPAEIVPIRDWKNRWHPGDPITEIPAPR